jgi:hypothetical protein
MRSSWVGLVLLGLGAGHCNGASIHPVTEAADLASDERLPGTWWSGSNQGWVIEPVAVGAYMARYFEAGDASFEIHSR